MTEIRVGIIDSNELVRLGRSMMINAQADMRVVLEESEPNLALDRAPNYLVDVLLVGENQHGFKPGEFVRMLTRQLADVGSRSSILVLASFANKRSRWEMLKNGASELLSLELPSEEFLSLIRAVRKPDFSTNRNQIESLIQEFGRLAPTRELSQAVAVLDGNQAEILNLFKQGIGDTEIAKRLDIAKLRVTQLIESLLALGSLTSRNQLLMAILEV